MAYGTSSQLRLERKLFSKPIQLCRKIKSQFWNDSFVPPNKKARRILRGICSLTQSSGAGDRDRTGDIQLGKLTLLESRFT